MQDTIIQMIHMILDCGKSTILTGDNAMVEMLHVIQIKTSIVQLEYMAGEATLGNFGQRIVLADVDLDE